MPLIDKVFTCGLVFLGACGDVDEALPDAAGFDVIDFDATADAPAARCDPSQPFGTPVLVGRLASVFDEASLSLTRNERIAFLGRENTGSPPTVMLSATRTSETALFGPLSDDVMVQLNNAPGTEHHPSTTPDGLVVYFERRSPTTVGIFAAPRGDTQSAFAPSTSVKIDGSPLTARSPVISSNGLTLYFLDTADSQLFSAVRGADVISFGAASLTSTMPLTNPVLSDDELVLLYSDAGEIFSSTRTAITEPFAPGALLDGVNSAEQDAPLALTTDGCVLLLKSTRPGGAGGADVYEAKRP